MRNLFRVFSLPTIDIIVATMTVRTQIERPRIGEIDTVGPILLYCWTQAHDCVSRGLFGCIEGSCKKTGPHQATMVSEQCVLDYMSRALWDPQPTKTDLRARQLAVALGYPASWRVVRTLEPFGVPSRTATTENDSPSNAAAVAPPKRTDRTSKNAAPYCIVDHIYAGKPGTGCDTWYHHQAAMAAAATWEDATSTPFDSNGGHLLPRLPLYAKGDKVQVLYENEWWDGSILRRKDYKDGFKYQIHYSSDGSKQSGVDESLIRRRPEAADPKTLAASMGLDGWEAFSKGHNRWKIVAPNGDIYHGKKPALLAYQKFLEQSNKDMGDPPWRRDGNDFLGRSVIYTLEHKASARRIVKIDQKGIVDGWIRETDVDRAGEPGFVSERTGKPARLYHVTFEEVRHHQYANLLLDSVDLEEYELEQCLVPLEDAETNEPPQKKARHE